MKKRIVNIRRSMLDVQTPIPMTESPIHETQSTVFNVQRSMTETPAQETQGTIFNIQRFTVHDGPGIRTEIFLKGCTLRCKWCSNPEGIRTGREVALRASRCIGVDVCGLCHTVCDRLDRGAIEVHDGAVAGIDRQVCNNCLACADVCPSDALSIYGKRMTVSQVMEVVRADRKYYQQSGGGVTFSGGEAFLQDVFLREVLVVCQAEGIHTCVESALDVPFDNIIETLPYMDLIICDIKQMDAQKHKQHTGRSNARVLANMAALARYETPMVVRIPVVPDYNCDEGNIVETARFIRESLGDCVRQVQLLRYRKLGEEKYDSLGMPYPMAEFKAPERTEAENRIQKLAETMREFGLPAVAGTTTPYA
ncbi:MAG: glycyl-radical enzyme activating protein [Proteobacteria bacterium]|nr:glycyl-radical enzyme activating protein [Pseudomonadota bacterium]